MTKVQLEQEVRKLKAEAAERVGYVERRTESWWKTLPVHPRTIGAFVVLAAVLGLIVAVLPDAGALGGWLATHAQFTLQVAFLGATAILVNAAYLLLQVTVLDPLLIGPEVKQVVVGVAEGLHGRQARTDRRRRNSCWPAPSTRDVWSS